MFGSQKTPSVPHVDTTWPAVSNVMNGAMKSGSLPQSSIWGTSNFDWQPAATVPVGAENTPQATVPAEFCATQPPTPASSTAWKSSAGTVVNSGCPGTLASPLGVMPGEDAAVVGLDVVGVVEAGLVEAGVVAGVVPDGDVVALGNWAQAARVSAARERPVKTVTERRMIISDSFLGTRTGGSG